MDATRSKQPLTVYRVIALVLGCLLMLAGVPAVAEISDLEHDLRVSLKPDQRLIEGEDRISLRGAGPVRFRLAEAYRLEAVSLNGRPIEVTLEGGVGQVDLGAEGAHRLTLSFSGRLPAAPPVDSATAAGPDRALLSEDYGYFPPGSGWYPEFDAGPFAYRLSVTLPRGQLAIAPGAPEEEPDGPDGQHRARFTSTRPAYEIPLFTGPYVMTERMEQGRRVRTYLFEGMESLAEEYLSFSHRYLALFERRVGPHPYPHFYVVAARLPVGLGFPGITYMGERVLRLPFIKYSSLGHEILHSWWGNGVQVDYARGNWAEGLTTYMADYFLVAQRSPEAARQRRLEWLRDYAALPPERDRPARRFTGKRHTASQVIGYNKVAFTFHMLERELGEQAFDEAIAAFWREERFRIAGWRDLERYFSQAAGRSLDAFFRQWLDRTGAATLALGAVGRSRLADGRWQLDFAVEQPPPGYGMEVEIGVQTRRGEIQRTLRVEGPRTPVSLTLEDEPLELVLDPDFQLFRRLGPDEAPPILRDTLLSARVQVVPLGSEEFRAQALALARAMADTPIEPTRSPDRDKPLLLIGPAERVDDYLQARGLPGMPEPLAVPGSAQAWAGRTPGGQAYAVVKAADLEALTALLRPLPHYGRKSYLVFEGSRATVTGVWPATGGVRQRLF